MGSSTVWQRVRVEYNATLAVRTNGSLRAWGLNCASQLGNGTHHSEYATTGWNGR